MRPVLRLAFLGTPEFAVPCLAALLEAGCEVAAVYSQPPRPRGRGQAVRPSPVQAFAEGRGLQVRTPASMKAAEEVEAFRALGLDAAVVVAFGQILVREVLETPRLGCFNLHGSLLPRWRGAAPIQRAIMAGDTETGVQVMRMSEGLDEGPVLFTARTPITPQDTAGTLSEKLSRAGAGILPLALQLVATGDIAETPQAGEPTYAKKIRPAEARIGWSRPAAEVDRHIRGLAPFPGAWFEAPSPRDPGVTTRVKALLSETADGGGVPAEVLDGAPLTVACGGGAVRLLRVQREGKGPQDAAEFLRGWPLAPGARLS